MYRAMPKEEGISRYKGPTRRAKPKEEVLYIAKCLTTRDTARRKSEVGKSKLDEILGM